VITNFAFNGDESTPLLHMTFVPYSDNCSRGQKTQNALAQTFTRMSYKTTMEQARDASDELVWQDTPEGKKPQMVRTAYGAVEWIEEQKNWIAEDMEKNIGWKRLYKGKNERGDLLLSDYRRERAAEKALEAEKERERNELALETVKKDAEEQLKQYDSQINSRELRLTLTDAMLEQKQKDLEELDVRTEQIKLECSEAGEKLADKKKEVETVQSELNNLEAARAEAEERKRVAEEVRAEIVAGADYGDLVDKVLNLTYENQKLQEENRGLRYKLNEAYEFMKQFVINGKNMLDVFRERIGEVKEWVRQMVAG
jgi:chromosome segregation ATPase